MKKIIITIMAILIFIIGILFILGTTAKLQEDKPNNPFFLGGGSPTESSELLDYTSNNGVYINTTDVNSMYDTLQKVKKMREVDYEFNKTYETFDEFYFNYFKVFKYSQKYDNDLDRDYIQTIEEFTRNNYTGDCDDSAFFLNWVATYVYDLDSYFVASDTHAWIEINETYYESTYHYKEEKNKVKHKYKI